MKSLSFPIGSPTGKFFTGSYLFRLIIALILGTAAASPTLAATSTWTGNSNNTWSTAGNWSGGIPNATTADVIFGTATNHTPNLTASTSVNSITYNSGGSAFTISKSGSGTLVLTSGGTVTNNSSNLQTFSTTITLSGASTWSAASGNLTLSGVISGASGSLTETGPGTLTLSGANTYQGGTTISSGTLLVGTGGRLGTGGVTDNGVLTYNSTGTITEANAITGTGSLNQTGTGTTSLTAANTYQGGTTISGGVLQFTSSALGTGAVTVNGGTLRWATGNTADVSSVLTLGSNGGTLDTNGNNVTLASALGGSGPLTKAGTGTLTLSAAPAGVTGITVNGGTLRPGAADVLPSGIAYTLNGTASSGTATLDLNNSNLTTGALTFGGSTSGASAINTVATGSAILTLGGNVTYSAAGSASDAGTASITGALDLGGSTRTFNIADSANTTTELSISAAISGTGAGLVVTGTGVLALSGSNTYTGGTTISGATLQFTSSGNFGTGPVTLTGGSSTLRWATGNTDGVSVGINLAGSGTLDTNGNNVTLTAPVTGNGWFYKAGTGSLTLASAPSLTNAFIQNGTLILSADNALPSNINLTVGSNVNNGSATLDLNGHNLTVGSLALGVNYSGQNSINTVTTGSGTLTLGGDVTYAIQGDPYDYYDPGTAVIAGKLDLGSSMRTFNIADSQNTPLDLNVTADVSGTGGLTKTGLGMMALSGTNTYSGNTIISSGTLRATLPGTTNLQMNGGVFELASDMSFVYGTGAGQIQWTGGGGGFSAFGGNRSVNIQDTGGASIGLVWGGGNFVANGSSLILSSLASDSTITLANNIDLGGATQTVFVNDGTAAVNAVLSGIISDGGLNITGGGTLKLTGSNTYAGGTTIGSYTNPETTIIYPTTVEFASGGLGTGDITISGGSTLRWAAGNTDGLGGTINIAFSSHSVSSEAILDTNGNDVVLNAALSAATVTVTKAGSGILTLNANSPDFNGYVSVTGGTLRFGVANALGSEQYGFATVNAATPNGSATLDTNGQDYDVYGLVFGGANAQANAINTVSTGTGTIFYTTGGNITYTKAAVAANDPGPAFLSGNLNLYQGAATFAIDDSSNTTAELTVSANISSTGNLGFTKTGAGVLVLSGNNTYTGNTTLSAGTLRVTSSHALSTTTLAIGGGIFELAGNNITLTNAITLGSAVRTISVLASGAPIDGTLTGAISGTGGISKTSAGTLKLAGTNTYTGNTTVTAGTMIFGSEKSLYNNTLASWTATKLTVQSGATAAFNVGGAGEFTSANIDTLKALGTSTGGFRNGSFLGLDTTDAAGGNFTYASNIANTNSGANVIGLNKLGTGKLTLTGTSTYTGATTVSSGTLQVDGSIANSATTVNAGTLQGKGTLGNVTLNAGSTLMAGDTATLGHLTVGSLLFNANATLQFKLDSSVALGDSLTLTGQLTLNNTQLVLTDLAALPFVLPEGTVLTMISYGAGMGTGLGSGTDIFTFNGQSLTEGSIFTSGANTFQINYAVGDPTITLTSITTTPEPGTWLLLASGLGLLTFIQSRKRPI